MCPMYETGVNDLYKELQILIRYDIPITLDKLLEIKNELLKGEQDLCVKK